MTKEELRQYRHLNEEIEDLMARIEDIRSAGIQSPKLDGLPRAVGGSGDPIGTRVEQITVLEAQLEAAIGQRDKIIKAITAIPDSQERMVLRSRYMDGYAWDQIAENMNYSERQIHRIHESALISIEGF